MNAHGDLLRDNFQEIYHAVHTSGPHTLPLVANFSGTRIYNARTGWGRFWRWFYQVVDWTGQNWRLAKLKQAIIHTHTLFHEQMATIKPSLVHYQDYLMRAGKSYEVHEKEYFNSRKAIAKLCESTFPFIKMMNDLHHPRFEKLLKSCFKPNKLSSTLFSSPEIEPLRVYRRIIRIESITQSPLPLAIFKKVFKGKIITPEENKELEKWAKKINKANLPPSKVHHALTTAISLYNPPQTSPERNLMALEALLEDKGCTCFQQIDPHHFEWQQQLKRGFVVSHRGIEYTLGSEINPSISDNDQMRVFPIQENPKLVALIAHNRVILALKYFRGRSEDIFGLESASLLSVSEDGRFALMERLQTLDQISWKSTQERLYEDDKPKLEAIIKFLRLLFKQNHMPAKLSTNLLAFDDRDQLKALKTTPKQPFDFNTLEDFVFACAQGNKTIFKHLMKASWLSKHEMAKYYQKTIVDTLKGDMTSEDISGRIYKIDNPKVIDRSIALRDEILRLHQQLLTQFRQLFPNKDPRELNRQIRDSILACYKASKAAGKLWHTLPQDVLENLYETMKKSSSELF